MVAFIFVVVCDVGDTLVAVMINFMIKMIVELIINSMTVVIMSINKVISTIFICEIFNTIVMNNTTVDIPMIKIMNAACVLMVTIILMVDAFQ